MKKKLKAFNLSKETVANLTPLKDLPRIGTAAEDWSGFLLCPDKTGTLDECSPAVFTG
jgi:hypothetical protein